MADKIILLLVEGATEIEFYKALINNSCDKTKKRLQCSFEYENLRGIGNYKNEALKRFNHIKKKNPDKDIYTFLCIDTDAFEFSKKPPIDKTKIKKALEEAGAKKVTYIEAKYSIEDWFLCDMDGVLDYLGLPKSTKKPEGKGQDALKKLFRKANKLYVKGEKVDGFVSHLNISRIANINCKFLKPLCDEGVHLCEEACKCVKTNRKLK